MRAHWLARQGLPGAKRDVAACLAHGWLYAGGGHLPYLALHARGRLRRKAIDDAVARGVAVEVQAVRACAMLVPADDVPLALAAGRAAFEAGPLRQAKKLGVTDRELAALGLAIVRALEAGPLDTVALRRAIDPARVRDLGERGKKAGFGTTLPIALDALHVAGTVRRASLDGRLDCARYAYALWDPAPARIALDPAALAARYLAWAAPATAQDLAWWTDTGVREARAILETAAIAKPPRARELAADDVVFLPFRDNYTHLHRALAPLVDARDAGVAIPDWYRGTVALGDATNLHQHTIIAGGAIAGVWDFDADAGQLHWATFTKPSPARRVAIEESAAATAAFVRDDLGDVKFYVLDNAANRAHRLGYLRAAKYRGVA